MFVRIGRIFSQVVLFAGVVAVAGCGDSTGPSTRIPTFVDLKSDPGDFIGAGRSYHYTQANADIDVIADDAGVLTITINGDETWQGSFAPPTGTSSLRPGTYAGLTRYPFHNPAQGGMSWSGEGRGCNTLTGSVTVDAVEYSNGIITSMDLHFEQHCEGATPALRGTIHWSADDTTAPAGPVNPVPSSLWQPPAGATPASGNYVYLQSDAGDFIGQGATNTYTAANSTITLSMSNGLLTVGVAGWIGEFKAMESLTQVQQGYYPGLMRFPFHNPSKGGLSWSGNGRGCNALTGWFAVDRITYSGNTVTGLDLRFEQHCEGNTPALRGKIHWG